MKLSKIKYSKLIAAILAAIFLFANFTVSAEYSYATAEHDYRMVEAINKQNSRVSKPTASFLAKRIVNGEVVDGIYSYDEYDCNAQIPTLKCYVGDTVAFEDHSKVNTSNSKINGWDWQYYGTLGNVAKIYSNNIVDKFKYYCSEPGETSFYLCVKDSTVPKKGYTNNWSENGNHQTVGKNKAYPKGIYWYFSAIKVIVEPVQKANVFVRCWDKETNSLIKETTVESGIIYGYQGTLDTSVPIENIEGYTFQQWNVQLADGTVQYGDITNQADITLAGWVPEKYLNVYYVKDDNLDVQTPAFQIDIRYINTETNEVIHKKIINPDTGNVNIELEKIDGYYNIGWRVLTPDMIEENNGILGPINVTLSDFIPYKIVIVDCVKEEEIGEDDEPIITPSGVCDGVITWTENDSHLVCVGTDSEGNAIYETCYHTFEYQTVLSASADVSPETFKSGYGFEVGVEYSINTQLISNTGACSSWGDSRSSSLNVSNPTKATVYISWTTTNRRGTQPSAIQMDADSSNRFILPENTISEVNARKIYTPVELPGTEEEPESHNFEIYLSGGGVGDIEFCKKLDCSITINGDMYSDDFSGADS